MRRRPAGARLTILMEWTMISNRDILESSRGARCRSGMSWRAFVNKSAFVNRKTHHAACWAKLISRLYNLHTARARAPHTPHTLHIEPARRGARAAPPARGALVDCADRRPPRRSLSSWHNHT